MKNTYLVSGILQKDGFIPRVVDIEVEATDRLAAIYLFEIDGREFNRGVKATLITEAMKLERAGEPSLFPLSPKVTS